MIEDGRRDLAPRPRRPPDPPARCPARARLASSSATACGVRHRPAGERHQRLGEQGVPRRGLEVGDDGLAQRARVPRDGRPHLEDLHGVVRTKDVVDDQHGRSRSAPPPAPTGPPARPASPPTAASGPAARGCRGTRCPAAASRAPAGTCRSPGPAPPIPAARGCGAARSRFPSRGRVRSASSVTPSRDEPVASALRIRAARSTDWIVPRRSVLTGLRRPPWRTRRTAAPSMSHPDPGGPRCAHRGRRRDPCAPGAAPWRASPHARRRTRDAWRRRSCRRREARARTLASAGA